MFLVCGEAVIDLFQDPRGDALTFHAQAAGSPFNVAVGLARLGHRASFVTGLSTDAFGGQLIAAMAREGVDWQLAPRTSRPTTLSFVMVGVDGVPVYAFYGQPSADADVILDALPATLPTTITAVHVGGFPMANEPAKSTYAALIRREAATRFISVDPNVRPALMGDLVIFRDHFERLCPSVALIKASRDDIAFLYPGAAPAEIAARWRGCGAGTIVITDGSAGAAVWSDACHVAVPAGAVAVVDTVGAGDSFMAALLSTLTERGLTERGLLAASPIETWQAMLGTANMAAGITCSRRGADPPHRATLAAAQQLAHGAGR